MQINIDTRQLTSSMKKLSRLGNQAPKAVYSALTRTLTFVTKTIKNDVKSTYEMKPKDLNQNIKIKKPSLTNLQAQVKSSGRPLTMIHFKINPSRIPKNKGVPNNARRAIQVKIKKTSGFKSLLEKPRPFLQKIKNAKNIFQRDGKKSLPLHPVRTLSIPQMVGNQRNIETMREQAQQLLANRLQHEIDIRLRGLNRSRGSSR